VQGYKGWHPKLVEIWTQRCVGRCVINRDMKICFVFVAKNASSTVKRLLAPWEMFRYCNPGDREFIDHCKTFTIVRDPYTRFISAYVEVNKLRKDSPWALSIAKAMPFIKVRNPVARFRQFIKDIDGKIHDLHLIPQVDYVLDSQVLIDDWLTFEQLGKQLPKFMADAGYPRVVSHANKSTNPGLNKRLHTVLMRDSVAKAIVTRIYKDDFKLFEEKARA